MNVEDKKVAELLAEIRGDLLLELLDLEKKSLERREPRSGD